MKRLVVHIGTHKTGTSSFQRYCFKFKELLEKKGVCYPSIKGYEWMNNHSVLAWALDKSSEEQALIMLNDIFLQFKEEKHHTLLISSEDFENSLLGSDQLDRLIRSAKNQNFNSFEILVVTRDPLDYLSSIYTELSKQSIVLNFSQIAEAALSYGYFSASTPHFNYNFAINAKHFIGKLSKEYPNASIKHYDLSTFVANFPGQSYLAQIAGEEAVQIMESIGLQKQFNNIKAEPLQAEINCVQNMLNGFECIAQDEDKRRELIILLAKERLALFEASKEEVADKLRSHNR